MKFIWFIVALCALLLGDIKLINGENDAHVNGDGHEQIAMVYMVDENKVKNAAHHKRDGIAAVNTDKVEDDDDDSDGDGVGVDVGVGDGVDDDVNNNNDNESGEENMALKVGDGIIVMDNQVANADAQNKDDRDDEEFEMNLMKAAENIAALKDPGMQRLARQLNQFHRMQEHDTSMNNYNDFDDIDGAKPEERAIRRRKRIRRRNSKNKIKRTHRNKLVSNRRKSQRRKQSNRKSVNRKNMHRTNSNRKNKRNNNVVRHVIPKERRRSTVRRTPTNRNKQRRRTRKSRPLSSSANSEGMNKITKNNEMKKNDHAPVANIAENSAEAA